MENKREKTIEQKQKDLFRDTIATVIMTTVFIWIIGLAMCAFVQDHTMIAGDTSYGWLELDKRTGKPAILTNDKGYPRGLQLNEIISGTVSAFVHNPFFMFPVSGSIYVKNLVYVFAIWCLIELMIFVYYQYSKIRVHHNINTIKGSAHWTDIKELVNKFADFDGKDYKTCYSNVILSENFQMSLNASKHYHALNTLILGATGSGKSRYFLKPNLLQMNASYVITDPSGGILQENGETLRRFGYNVKVFDLVQMGNCDTYNPLKYCKKESDIKKVVQAFIKNTDSTGGKGGGNKDPFWDDAMNAFMCACIAFLTTCPEGSDIPYAKIEEVTGGNCYEACFANLCELTRMANKKYEPGCGIALGDGVRLGDGKNNTANASELAAIFENLRMYEAKRQDCDPDVMKKPYCLREWENFRIAPEKTSTTILMTTAVRLDPFNIEQVRNLTSSDTLDLTNFGNQRDVLFVITPTNDRTFNYLVNFLYTQLFDILYQNGETKSAGSFDLKLPNGELVHHFPKALANGDIHKVEPLVNVYKDVEIKRVDGNGILHGKKTVKRKKYFGLFGKTIKTTVDFKLDDGWYEIVSKETGELITRRPTEHLAKEYVNMLQKARLVPGNGKSVPTHVRFLLDEFPNLGEIPEFKEKLATMRKYEISCTVICQSITQLKGMYPDDYEVIDANCPQKIFLGGDENSNNEYLSKKLGTATVKSMSNNLDNKKASSGYQVDGKELMKADELGRIPFSDEIVLIYGENPIYDKKYDYPAHKNYKYTHDYACDIGLHEAIVFDRSKYHKIDNGPAIYKFAKQEAIPIIQHFSKDIFCAIMMNSDISKAEKTAIDGAIELERELSEPSSTYKRESLESTSEAFAV